MLTREDYKRYLDQMDEIEINMIKIYSECASLAEDEELKNILLKLVADERRHSRLVASLKSLFLT